MLNVFLPTLRTESQLFSLWTVSSLIQLPQFIMFSYEHLYFCHRSHCFLPLLQEEVAYCSPLLRICQIWWDNLINIATCGISFPSNLTNLDTVSVTTSKQWMRYYHNEQWRKISRAYLQMWSQNSLMRLWKTMQNISHDTQLPQARFKPITSQTQVTHDTIQPTSFMFI
jgi:hypothetical protein